MTLQTLIKLTTDLAEIFERMGLRYALGGALANNYWGIVRATQDVDCLVLIPALRFQELADNLNALCFVQQDAVGAAIPVNALRMRQQSNDRKLIEVYRERLRAELFVPVIPLQDEILRRAVALPLEHRKVMVTTAEDLILLKLIFRREKDLRDIRGILWSQHGKLDLDYVREWSDRMFDDETRQSLEELIREYQTRHGPAY